MNSETDLDRAIKNPGAVLTYAGKLSQAQQIAIGKAWVSMGQGRSYSLVGKKQGKRLFDVRR